MCTVSRKRRVVLDLNQLLPPLRPSAKLVKKLVCALKVDYTTLCAVQIVNGRQVAVLDFANSTAAAAAVATKNLEYQGCKIPVYLDNDAMDIRLLDLPLGVSNEEIAKTMSQYGEILGITNERWVNFFPGVLNGVRTLRIIIKQQPPKSIMVNNHRATVMVNGAHKKWNLKPTKSNSTTNNINNATSSKNQEQSTAATSNRNNKHNVDSNTSKKPKNNKSTDSLSSNNSNSNMVNSNMVNSNEQSSSTTNSNNNINYEKSSDSKLQSTDEGFEIVRSKNQRKALKRQHSLEGDNDSEYGDKLFYAALKKQLFYFGKMKSTQLELDAETDTGRREQLEDTLEEYITKHDKYLNMMQEMCKEKL